MLPTCPLGYGTRFAVVVPKKRTIMNNRKTQQPQGIFATRRSSPQRQVLLSADKATLFLRLFIGAVLFTEAITKSQQYPWLEGEYPALWGLSGADIVSIAGVVEAIAGVMITIGLLTRLTAGAMAVVMVGAAFLFFPHQSFDQAELKIIYAGIYITLAISGGGRYSLDALLFPNR